MSNERNVKQQQKQNEADDPNRHKNSSGENGRKRNVRFVYVQIKNLAANNRNVECDDTIQRQRVKFMLNFD